ncbi:GNAT family N-acetyltransferase [Vibrio sp. vnigr-6D03]|uniref:GNAT family N-acetyltransferase n=1 Tax=Vibrio sp. vnigr-6D03 TaxID=2058088 RepID=UPI000C3421A4|nr:GNAT family protein [Vibrio sp. vnigr-6D03]PKF80332.1 GNAT family N-acetyltransferase [Vibrio sp. vnigr-6D03]
MTVIIRKAFEDECQALHNLVTKDEEWTKYNGPYFGYTRPTKDVFRTTTFQRLLKGEDIQVIEWNGKPVGTVSCYWEDENTRWLESGVVIYDSKAWGQGIAHQALSQWVSHIFATRELERVGLTTWSGNPAMMKCAEKLGFKLEGRLRKVRFYKGTYYDSVRYGILKEEWMQLGSVNEISSRRTD